MTKKYKMTLVAGIAVVLCAVLFGKYVYYAFAYGTYIVKGKLHQPSGTCLTVPVQLDKAGASFSCDVEIPAEASFSIELVYPTSMKNRKDWLRVRSIVDSKSMDSSGKEVKQGAPVAIGIKISDESNQTVLDKKIQSPVVHGYAQEALYADLLITQLTPGRYKVSYVNIQNAPDMKAIETEIQFRLYQPK